jgi:hypothetical protein
MALGSYLRFFLGIILSLEVLRAIIFGSGLFYAGILAVIYIILTVMFVIWRF